MDEEITLDRGNATVMKLDDDEQAIMDEIQISAPRIQKPKRPQTIDRWGERLLHRIRKHSMLL